MSEMFYIAGKAAAGKTTLVRGALQVYNDKLKYLTTYTTRAPRGRPEDEPEYVFVTRDEYERKRASSKQWDHGEYYNNWYGSDVEAARQTLEAGTSLIVTTMPDVQAINEMAAMYGVEPLIIYVNTARYVRMGRLAGRTALSEIARINKDDQLTAFTQLANRTFEPENILQNDISAFNQLIGEYIYGK